MTQETPKWERAGEDLWRHEVPGGWLYLLVDEGNERLMAFVQRPRDPPLSRWGPEGAHVCACCRHRRDQHGKCGTTNFCSGSAEDGFACRCPGFVLLVPYLGMRTFGRDGTTVTFPEPGNEGSS